MYFYRVFLGIICIIEIINTLRMYLSLRNTTPSRNKKSPYYRSGHYSTPLLALVKDKAGAPSFRMGFRTENFTVIPS